MATEPSKPNNCAIVTCTNNASKVKRDEKTDEHFHRNFEIDGAFKKNGNSMASWQSFNYMVKSMSYVFKHLQIHELLLASQVCTSWNMIVRNILRLQPVCLKNSMVFNWNKCIDAINDQLSVSLDMRHMLIPTKIEHFDKFWLDFTIALKKAQRLKCLELYRCPANVVEDTICSLPQLTVLNATSIENANILKKGNNPIEFMTLNLHSLGQMTNLTEVRIKGLTRIKLINLPSFESLVNLKSLSLTSIKAFPKDVYCTLETLSTSLEFFEIGDCDCLSKDFAGVIKRLTNLTSLRLENCYGEFEHFAKEVFSSIRGLDKLKILELINIKFTVNVKDELEKCTNIKALLIIPVYVNQSAATNCHLIDCLKKLSKTLTHLVWGLTLELLRCTELFITLFKPSLHTIGYSPESFNIPIMKTIEQKQRPGEEPVTDEIIQKCKSDNVDIVSVPHLEIKLKQMMINAKTKVVQIPFKITTQICLLGYFNDL